MTDSVINRDINAGERKLVSIHFACRAAMARHFGGIAKPHIWPVCRGPVTIWQGNCAAMSANDGFSETDRRMIGLAGFVGEVLHLNRHRKNQSNANDKLNFADYLAEETIARNSAIDDGWTEDNFEYVAMILRMCWPFIKAEARSLERYWATK